MIVKLSKRANADLQAIRDHLQPLDAKAARNVIADIRSTLRRLSEMPMSGRIQTEAGVRKAVSPKYGMLIYYRLDEVISVITIQDGERRREFNDA